MRKYLIVSMILAMLLVSQIFTMPIAYATTETYTETVIEYNPDGSIKTAKEITHTKVDFWQTLLGVIAYIVVTKLIVEKCPGAFVNIEVPSGWYYVTDGETFLRIYPYPSIDDEGIYGPVSWYTNIPISQNPDLFQWATYNLDGDVIEEGYFQGTVGGIVVSVDKFGLLAPYIAYASTILAATVASAIYVKRVKRREEKQ